MNIALFLIAIIALFIALNALRRLWRAFIRVTNRWITEGYEDLRRRGITFDEQPPEPRQGGRR